MAPLVYTSATGTRGILDLVALAEGFNLLESQSQRFLEMNWESTSRLVGPAAAGLLSFLRLFGP